MKNILYIMIILSVISCGQIGWKSGHLNNNNANTSTMDKELKDLIKDTKERALSLAVQEIRKEKKEEPKKCICDRYTHCAWHTLHGGINQGLDKAIEIISGLMKK